MVERSTSAADSGGFGGLRWTARSDLPGEMDRSDGSGNPAKVRVVARTDHPRVSPLRCRTVGLMRRGRSSAVQIECEDDDVPAGKSAEADEFIRR
jgi:hypothetical protein